MSSILKKLVLLLVMFCSSSLWAKPKVLIFCKTAGFHHKSIGPGITALQLLGKQNKFNVDTTTDATRFSYNNLKKYDAVIFLNTTGDVLNDAQQLEFQKYIRSGKGFVGIHAATDTEYEWPWYGQLSGAYFSSHPKVQQAVLQVVEPANDFTKHLPAKWTKTDEWYNFKWISDKLHVVLTLDESSYTGGKNGVGHPMSWYQEFEGGRVFTTALGHTDESYTDPLFLQHVLAGIKYAIGKK
ncbi:ThuA domain-containing protein [Mucilaginibacter sp. PAMB04274]|uniref:ThuA domain-containing protein n=1 Tax=Mucilaginibacter sp. PAMB04274 TaxID=3138568 RepID=UPI0031F60412